MSTAVATDQDKVVTAPPEHPDGRSWSFAMIVRDETVYGDTLTDLVSHVIPGYADIPLTSVGQSDAFLARVNFAAGAVATAQSVVLASAVVDRKIVLERTSEDVLTALLTPRGLGLIDSDPFNGAWNEPAPLLLLTTDFQPFFDQVPFTGNVQWFDPSDERTFLESLSEFGFVEIFMSAPE